MQRIGEVLRIYRLDCLRWDAVTHQPDVNQFRLYSGGMYLAKWSEHGHDRLIYIWYAD
jgi:hypothetical protein